MAPEADENVTLEIGHVLFIDIVGYSKLLLEEQKERLTQLTDIVLATPQVRESPDELLVRLPTGDGMALVFHRNAEEPARCALEIAEALRNHPELPVRMGIHSGPVSEVSDVNGRTNIAGAGINIAQRVMDCGDAGHILLSQHVADDLVHSRQWAPRLRDLGECEVKHGVRLHLVNLYAEPLGNAALPQKFQRAAPKTLGKPARSRVGWIAALALVTILGAWAAHYFASRQALTTGDTIPDKSVAVLPFANLSGEKENAYFTDGVQDEILGRLARIADLKVISRTSVMQYKSPAAAGRNLREIARQLGVRNVIEGSVQRAGNRVRVSVQLINAANDAHLWAEHFDRDLADTFAIETEIGDAVARKLNAVLSPAEQAAVSSQPTRDIEAFDLYLRAKELITNFHDTSDWKETLLRASRLLDEAISRDSKFALAYCWLSRAHDQLYWFNLDPSPARLAQAKAAAQAALELGPDLGEAHLAQAYVFYHGDRDYPRALAELEIARRTLPNSAELYALLGYITRRQGRWEDALANLKKAVDLDPRNPQILSNLSITFDLLRRYDDKLALYDRAAAIQPSSRDYFQMMRAQTHLERGDLDAPRKLVQSLPEAYDPDGVVTFTRLLLALYERNLDGARQLLAGTKLTEMVGNGGVQLPISWFQGCVARAMGDSNGARAAFADTRAKLESKVREKPDDAVLLAQLAVVDAGLLRREEALAGAQRAAALRPISQDAVDGPTVLGSLALTYAWLGDVDSALEQLIYLAKIPGGPDYGELKLNPMWDDLRRDPRFAQMLATLEPAKSR